MKTNRSWISVLAGVLFAQSGAAWAAGGVTVTKVWPDKLVYGFDSPGTCTVTLAAAGKALEGTNKTMRTAHLKLELLSRLDRVDTLDERAVEVAVGETKPIPVAFRTGKKKDGAEYGYEVRATLTAEGQSNSVACEYFMVTDDPVKVGHLTIPTGMCDDRDAYSFGTALSGAERMRNSYFCIAETAFWAPCDFSELTTTREYWTSGQAGRYNSQKGMKAQAEDVHALGGRIVIYADKWACGAAGFENARRHPEWYHWGQDWYGCKFDVEVLDWIEAPTFADGKWKPHQDGGIWAICPLLGKPEVAQFGIDQIAGSMKQFDWDGIRFDNCGWYVEDVKDILGQPAVKPGTSIPQLEADLVRRIKDAERKVKPHFVYGDNVGWFNSVSNATPKWLAEAADGGLVMNEGMNEISHAGGKLNNWAFLRDYLRTAIPTVRQAGGYPYGIVGIAQDRMWTTDVKPVRPDAVIMYAVLMGSGMHICYHVTCDYWPYMRLFARYCGLFYDDALQFVTEPAALLSVTGPRDIWWKEYVRRRDLPDGRSQFIVHLINPSTGERYDEKNAGPAPQQNVAVRLMPPAGMKITKALALSADGATGPVVTPLSLTRGTGDITVTVPELKYWTLVVFEGEK